LGLKIHLEAFTLDLYFIGGFIPGRKAKDHFRAGQVFAGSHIELRAVPGTGDGMPLKNAFRKVASGMGAFAADGVKLTVKISYQNVCITHKKGFHSARGYLVRLSDLNKTHQLPPISSNVKIVPPSSLYEIPGGFGSERSDKKRF
jgi:hypothetical protein